MRDPRRLRALTVLCRLTCEGNVSYVECWACVAWRSGEHVVLRKKLLSSPGQSDWRGFRQRQPEARPGCAGRERVETSGGGVGRRAVARASRSGGSAAFLCRDDVRTAFVGRLFRAGGRTGLANRLDVPAAPASSQDGRGCPHEGNPVGGAGSCRSILRTL